ncbi:MAG: YlbF family regulator [bacterium]
MAEVNQDKIEEKAKQLGRAIGQTEAAKAMETARESLEDNEETSELFEKVQDMEQDLMEKAQRGEDVSDEEEQDLRDAMQKLESRPDFQKFVAAQQNFEKMMKKVNEYIQNGIEEGKDSNIIEI